MLRLSADKTTVETSRGATVPVQHAKRVLRVVQLFQGRRAEYIRGDRSMHLGHYTVDKIAADGTLYAGCHVIPYSEIERIAGQLDLIADEREAQE